MAGERRSYTGAEAERLAKAVGDEIEERWSRGEEPGGPMVRSRVRAKMTTIMNVRMPVEVAEQLHAVAEASGVAPSTLVREWVLQRLAYELSGEPDPRLRMAVRAELERAGLVKETA